MNAQEEPENKLEEPLRSHGLKTYPNTSETSPGGTEGGVVYVNLQASIKVNAQITYASTVTCMDM